jgi:hypothetical protein
MENQMKEETRFFTKRFSGLGHPQKQSAISKLVEISLNKSQPISIQDALKLRK